MGIFDSSVKLFTTYRTTITFRDKIMGGTPLDPRIIESWIRIKGGIDQVEELRQATRRTLIELGVDVPAGATYEELEKASSELAGTKNTNGFKRDDSGLYVESRTIKAALKENTNILFAGKRWGVTKKGPRSFLAERVFINPDHISLGQDEPSGVELFIGHTNGPKGPQSNLTYHQFVHGATITFDCMSAEDAVSFDDWKSIWVLAQENGLGALRSQGFGRFDIEQFEQVETSPAKLAAAVEAELIIQQQRERAVATA